MPSIKDLTDRCRKALGDDSAKVETLLREIEGVGSSHERELQEKTDDLKAANDQAAKLRIEIRDVHKPANTKLEDEKAELLKKIEENDNSGLATEVESLRGFKTKILDRQKSTFINAFNNVISKSENPQVLARYKVPDKKDKDGNIIFDGMSAEDLEHNVLTFEEHRDLGLFGDPSKLNINVDISKDNDSRRSETKTIEERLKIAKTPADRDAIFNEVAADLQARR